MLFFLSESIDCFKCLLTLNGSSKSRSFFFQMIFQYLFIKKTVYSYRRDHSKKITNDWFRQKTQTFDYRKYRQKRPTNPHLPFSAVTGSMSILCLHNGKERDSRCTRPHYRKCPIIMADQWSCSTFSCSQRVFSFFPCLIHWLDDEVINWFRERLEPVRTWKLTINWLIRWYYR